ncbi:MAG: hypothetical protein DMG96_37255 [Acidobacteria bacterium]|nr:MAG: hypothetical protein DMG96_37255 [Acidobacteriota bacterium]
MNRKRELILFFVLAHGFSWLVFVPLVIFHGPLQWVILATFGPTFAALVTNRIVAGNYRAFRVSTSWARTMGATVLGVVVIVFVYVVLPAVTTADPRTLKWSILISLTVYNYSTLLGGPLGCAKKKCKLHAAREMREGPSKPLCRERLQTATSCCGTMATVVNVVVKSVDRPRQVGMRETNASEPPIKHRNLLRRRQNRGLRGAPGSVWWKPVYWPDGVRCIGGVTLI